MASSTVRSDNLPLLPEAMARALRRRLEQCLGWTLALAALAMPEKVSMTPQTVPSNPMKGPPATAVLSLQFKA